MGGGGHPEPGRAGPGPDRTLVIQTAFLGDVVLATGLLDALAARHGPVDVVTTPAARPLVETHPAVRRAIAYDKRRLDRGLSGLLRLARMLRREGYARAVLPHRSLRSAAIARLAGIPERIGFAGGPASWSYTRVVEAPAGVHDAERQLALAADGVDARSGGRARVSLGLTGEDRLAADRWLTERGITGDFTALAPGSIWGTKRWGGYVQLAARLQGPVVVLGGPDDLPLAREVAAAAGERGHSAAGALPLRVSAALLERARVLVTNDSAPLHLAGAVGTRTVAIFGPTVPAFGFGPRGARDRIIEIRGLECRPCSHHGPETCPLGHHKCMQMIAVGTVLEAVDE